MADQYSLGCVLYECLTGRVPFEKDLDAAIIWAHVEEPPTRLTLLRPDLPPAIDEVFARVLAKQPGDRYENCREFVAAARRALAMPDAPTAAALGGGFARGAGAARPHRPLPPGAPTPRKRAHDRSTRTRAHDAPRRAHRPAGHDRRAPRGPLAAAREPAGAAGTRARPRMVAAVPVQGAPGDPPAPAPGGPGGAGTGGRRPAPTAPTAPTAQATRMAAAASAAPTRPRRVPVLLLALAFVLTAGIGITLGSWLGFPGRADSGQQPGAGLRPAASGRRPASRPRPPRHAGDRRGAHAAHAARRPRRRPSSRPWRW